MIKNACGRPVGCTWARPDAPKWKGPWGRFPKHCHVLLGSLKKYMKYTIRYLIIINLKMEEPHCLGTRLCELPDLVRAGDPPLSGDAFWVAGFLDCTKSERFTRNTSWLPTLVSIHCKLRFGYLRVKLSRCLPCGAIK